jgi:CRISPR system Cascade subunit CasB
MSQEPRFDEVSERARKWWRDLQPDDDGARGERAALARLRRAASPLQAMTEEATLALFRKLGLASAERLPRVAVIAMVLAHVRKDAPSAGGFRPPAIRAVGRTTLADADSATMSPLRFRRLLAARTEEELATAMRRLVALADCQINVGDLAASLFFWGDKVRTRWAFEYYAAGAAAPQGKNTAA